MKHTIRILLIVVISFLAGYFSCYYNYKEEVRGYRIKATELYEGLIKAKLNYDNRKC